MLTSCIASTLPPRLAAAGSAHSRAAPPAFRALPPATPRRASLATCASRGEAQAELERRDIDGLNRDYCDDFVCTNSPAVESTVRALARDITRANGVWTKSLLSRNVEYKDQFRSFKGVQGYQRLDFVGKKVTGAEATVTGMRMADGESAVIEWRLRGKVGPLPVDVGVTTTIRMNLLTGQIERHTEAWDLSRCSPPAAAAWTLSRAAWSARVGAADAGDATNSLIDSLTSMDSDADDPGFSADPNDPMKFFQPKDSFQDDAIFYLGGVAVLYVIVQAYTTLFSS